MDSTGASSGRTGANKAASGCVAGVCADIDANGTGGAKARGGPIRVEAEGCPGVINELAAIALSGSPISVEIGEDTKGGVEVVEMKDNGAPIAVEALP